MSSHRQNSIIGAHSSATAKNSNVWDILTRIDSVESKLKANGQTFHRQSPTYRTTEQVLAELMTVRELICKSHLDEARALMLQARMMTGYVEDHLHKTPHKPMQGECPPSVSFTPVEFTNSEVCQGLKLFRHHHPLGYIPCIDIPSVFPVNPNDIPTEDDLETDEDIDEPEVTTPIRPSIRRTDTSFVTPPRSSNELSLIKRPSTQESDEPISIKRPQTTPIRPVIRSSAPFVDKRKRFRLALE